MPHSFPMLKAASVPTEVLLGAVGASAEYKFVEADAGEGKPKLKTFSGTAYTGGLMQANYSLPVAIDLSGLTVAAASVPALKDHDPAQIVGHQSVEITAQRIKVKGEVSGVGPAAEEVTALSRNGFPWQMSVGVAPSRVEFVDRNEKVNVNGRSIEGPAYVVRAGVLREVSFVAMGADSNTSGTVAASFNKGSGMDYEAWLKAKGWDAATLSEQQIATLKAAYEAEQKPAENKPQGATLDAVQATGFVELKSEIAALKASLEGEKAAADRSTVLAQYAGQIDAAKLEEIRASATKESWSREKVELACLRASRPSGPAIHIGGPNVPTTDVLMCALSRTMRLKDVEKDHKPQTLEAADKFYRSGIGIKRLLLVAAAANGMPVSVGASLDSSNLREVLRFAFGLQASGYSTVAVSSILENVANKSLLQGYMEVDQTWREITYIMPVVDFKDHKSYRLLDDMTYEELSPTGEIKHGSVSDETITRSADTYAKMFSLTRKQIINDDLGAFQDLRNRLGRGAALKFNSLFWAAFLDNSSFFTTARTNYISGSNSNLGTDGVGLGLGVKAFRQMTTPSADGTKQIGNDAVPTKLLVPPELEGAAEVLFRNQNLGQVASSSANIYANKYRPIVQNRLSNSGYTGYSTTAWYLFGDLFQPMWATFLNGNESPTVESAEADFDTLGVLFRGYHDFGAGQNEYLAGLKSKGAA